MPADPTTSAAPLTTAERNAQEAVREQGLCGAIGNGRVCIRDPHRGPHGFETMPEPDTAARLTSAQARSLIGSTVEIWSNDEAEASEGVSPDWLGNVADVVSVGDKWHFVIQED